MHPHVHASMFLSQKTSKGEERKPEAPEKLLHIHVAGLMISSKGSVFLKQEIFFPEWQVSLSSMDKAASQWNTWWQNHTEDSVLKGLYQTKQAVSKPTFPLYPECYCWIIVTAFPQNYLPMLQQSFCLPQLSDTFKNMLVEPGLVRTTTFWRPLLQNENLPYSCI